MQNLNFASAFSAPNFERGATMLNSVKLSEDPENNRKLVLVGTLKALNTLAERTQKLIERSKPDSGPVQPFLIGSSTLITISMAFLLPPMRLSMVPHTIFFSPGTTLRTIYAI